LRRKKNINNIYYAGAGGVCICEGYPPPGSVNLGRSMGGVILGPIRQELKRNGFSASPIEDGAVCLARTCGSDPISAPRRKSGKKKFGIVFRRRYCLKSGGSASDHGMPWSTSYAVGHVRFGGDNLRDMNEGQERASS